MEQRRETGAVSCVGGVKARVPLSPLALAFGSGFVALIHELAWTRRLVDLVGAGPEAVARVFGCFFLGLALGAALGAVLCARTGRPWLWAAVAEAAVGVLALPVVFLPAWTDGIWPVLGLEGLQGFPGWAVKTVLSVAVVVPPAIAMGLTLPLMLEGWTRHTSAGARPALKLYAVNTLGGGLGLLFAVAFAIHAWGILFVMVAAAAGNFLLATGCLWNHQSGARLPSGNSAEGRFSRLPVGLLMLSFLSGFGVLSIEIAASRTVMLVAPTSFFSPAAVLASAILCLALAAVLAPRFLAMAVDAGVALILVPVATAVLLVFAPWIFMQIVLHGNPFAFNATLPGFLLKLFALLAFTFGPALLCAGLLFPILLGLRGNEKAVTGSELGFFLCVNGFGGLAGAEITNRLILPIFGIHGSFGVLAAVYGVVGLVLARRRSERLFLPGAMGFVALIAVCLAVLPTLPVVNPHARLTVLSHRVGPEGSVAVVENERTGRSILLSNQYQLGGTGARWSQERQTHLALLLHSSPRDAAFIGMATGISPGAALSHTSVRSVTAFEISPLVVRAAEEFFGDFNHDLFSNRRAGVVVEDGRIGIAAVRGQYDVLVGDLFLPWGTGDARLYSIEHFRNARRALRPGGVFVQWLAMYQLTPAQFRLIADTFQAAFSNTFLFANGFDPYVPALALVGFADDDAEVDWDQVSRQADHLRREGTVTDPLVRHGEAVRLCYLGKWQVSGPELNTLNNMQVELDAGVERIVGKPGEKYHFGSRWLDFVRERRVSAGEESGGGRWDDPTVDLIAGILAAGRGRAAGSPRDTARIRLPSAFAGDNLADWSRVPELQPLFREGRILW